MSRKLVAMAMVAVWVGWPTAASACDFTFAYHLIGVPESGATIGAGIGIAPLNGDGDAILTPSAGVVFALGERVGLAPIIGYCKGTGDSDELGEVMFGGGAVFNLWASGDAATNFNVQTHAAYASYGDDQSSVVFPVMAVIAHALSEGVMVYGQGGLVFDRFSSNGSSNTESDVQLGGGVAFGSGNVYFQTGLTLLLEESENQVGLVAAISTGIG